MLGPPASGKGTQAVRLAQRAASRRFRPGDILREAAPEQEASWVFAPRPDGSRASCLGDAEMIGIVNGAPVAEADAADGFILDGFPRHRPQAEELDRMLNGQPLVVIDSGGARRRAD